MLANDGPIAHKWHTKGVSDPQHESCMPSLSKNVHIAHILGSFAFGGVKPRSTRSPMGALTGWGEERHLQHCAHVHI
eukprot:6466413-Amphidinium_carterae.1